MNNIKKITMILALVSVALLILSFVNQPNTVEENEEILSMRVIESINASAENGIIIVNEDGKVEKIKFDKMNVKDFTTPMTQINKALNRISNDGYKLVSTTGSGDQFVIITTYTFVKK